MATPHTSGADLERRAGPRWLRRARRLGLRLAAVLATVLLTLLAVRVWDTRGGPPLEPWHTVVPEELPAEVLDRTDWTGYLAAEARVFETVQQQVTQRLGDAEAVPWNRYFDASPVYPPRFAQDWNRSFVLEPAGAPRGAVVLLHGLTDSPYSGRHVALHYQSLGYVAIAPRLPGHGTVPAGLTDVEWQDWAAATRLAVREARRRIGNERPLHLVGFSNGGALALKYALDAIDDPALPRVERIVLLSPMIGITDVARFAGIAGWPAVLPPFAKAAWLSLLPEFNPFKYNSFPVNAARQSSLLTRALQPRLARYARAGRLTGLPPVLTFQPVTDATVSARAVVDALYAQLPANGSELVLFDMNRMAGFGPLLRPATAALRDRLLPPAPRAYRTVLLTNDPALTAGAAPGEVVARITAAGATDTETRPLGLRFPDGVFALSHGAPPFPLRDGLYGLTPDPADDFGIQLGALALRGERGTLIVSLDALNRMASNPFFDLLLERIDAGIDARGP